MENHGKMMEKPAKTMENHGKQWKNHGKPWKTMENHGKMMEKPAKTMENHGKQWKNHGTTIQFTYHKILFHTKPRVRQVSEVTEDGRRQPLRRGTGPVQDLPMKRQVVRK